MEYALLYLLAGLVTLLVCLRLPEPDPWFDDEPFGVFAGTMAVVVGLWPLFIAIGAYDVLRSDYLTRVLCTPISFSRTTSPKRDE